MMGREVKRVPEGFRWPIGKVWFGYVLDAIPCELCGGDGKATTDGRKTTMRYRIDGEPREWNSEYCHVCEGEGEASPKIEIPEGDYYQLWETVSEGSPCSPPFATQEELARYLADHGDGSRVNKGTTYEQWLSVVKSAWCPSGAFSMQTGWQSGPEAIHDEKKESD